MIGFFSFTLPNSLETHLGSRISGLFLFIAELVFPSMDVTTGGLTIFTVEGRLDYFQFGAITNISATNVPVQVFV